MNSFQEALKHQIVEIDALIIQNDAAEETSSNITQTMCYVILSIVGVLMFLFIIKMIRSQNSKKKNNLDLLEDSKYTLRYDTDKSSKDENNA